MFDISYPISPTDISCTILVFPADWKEVGGKIRSDRPVSQCAGVFRKTLILKAKFLFEPVESNE